MVNLEPIKKKIQQRLLQKQRLLGSKNREIQSGVNQPTVNNNIPRLTYDKLATRTPFLRMTSGLEQPIILMGGELEDDGSVVSGYEDMYGPRRLDVYEDGELIGAGDTANSFRRPLPGVKSVEAQFQGGLKASRKATVNWSCWSFEDITRLTPHFLQHGHSVLVEWGWVYDKESLLRMPNFIQELGFEGGKIKPDVFKDYQTKIVDNYGDIDVMAGVISNYEYSTRQDGGFDCTTTITSLGVNMFDREEESSDVIDSSVIFNLSEDDNEETRNEKIKNIDSLINYNTNTTFKAFLNTIDKYLLQEWEKTTKKKTSNSTIKAGIANAFYETVTRFNKPIYIIKINPVSVGGTGVLGTAGSKEEFRYSDAWVKWGWFEDNILSKFTAITNKNGETVCAFRSIDNFGESEKIRNHKFLETFDYKKYILPGQFKPISTNRTIDNINLSSDGSDALGLKSEVDKFPDFAVENDLGSLRNMLINVNVIKKAFGVFDLKTDGEDFSFPASTMNQGITTLFKTINDVAGFNYWNFQLKENEDGGELIKIVDNDITFLDFNRSLKEQRTTVNENGELLQEGVFFFPVWEKDSLVKNQNLQAKIPSSLQIATMYGANTDGLKEVLGKSANHSTQGVIAGALGGNRIDAKYRGADIAIRNKESQNIGTKNGELVSNNNDSSLFDFLNQDDTKELLSKNYGTELKQKSVKNATEVTNSIIKYVDEKFDTKQPTPLPSDLGDSDFKKLFEIDSYLTAYKLIQEEKRNLTSNPDIDGDGIPNYIDIDTPENFEDAIQFRQIKLNEYLKKKFEELKALYSGKYDINGVMKQAFQDSIKQRIQYFGQTSDEKIPVLVPFELELEIDGIGGIYPGNSFHSTYLPKRYQDLTVFQMTNVNHTVNDSGWTTTLTGKMRTTLRQILQKFDSVELEISVQKAKEQYLAEAIRDVEQSTSLEDVKNYTKSGKLVDELSNVNRFKSI